MSLNGKYIFYYTLFLRFIVNVFNIIGGGGDGGGGGKQNFFLTETQAVAMERPDSRLAPTAKKAVSIINAPLKRSVVITTVFFCCRTACGFLSILAVIFKILAGFGGGGVGGDGGGEG